MTLFFLQNIPKPKPNSNILDVGSGSGIIAGWLQSVEPSIHLHLVDSDAVALKAAKKNVKGAKYTCAWSVSNLQGGDKFDWVVSNPPVHQGRKDVYIHLQMYMNVCVYLCNMTNMCKH